MQVETINPRPTADSLYDKDKLSQAVKAFILFTQGIFRIFGPESGHQWTPDPESTQVEISSEEPISGEQTNQRPRIVIVRGPAQIPSLSMSQTRQLSFSAPDFHFMEMIRTSISITVTAREGLEAQALAMYIMGMIPCFRAEIIRLGGLHDIDNQLTLSPETTLGQIVPGSSTPEWKAVQLSFGISIPVRLGVEPANFSSILRDVTTQMNIDLSGQ